MLPLSHKSFKNFSLELETRTNWGISWVGFEPNLTAKVMRFHTRFSFYPVLFSFIVISLTYCILLYFLTLEIELLEVFTWKNDNIIVELKELLGILRINLTKKGVRLGMRKWKSPRMIASEMFVLHIEADKS